MRTLLVEDDPIIAKNIKIFLNHKGFSIDIAKNLSIGYQKTIDETYDLLILDRKLPDGEGVELVKKLRNVNKDIPILILTAKNQNQDVVDGLTSGADDYLSKPFDMQVLLARAKTLIRRGVHPIKETNIIIKDLTIDTDQCKVTRGGKLIILTPREYSLLEYLAKNKCIAIDRMTLLTHAWDENVDLFSNTVDVHIKYLRNKIDKNYKTKLIKTIRGKGYMLCDE